MTTGRRRSGTPTGTRRSRSRLGPCRRMAPWQEGSPAGSRRRRRRGLAMRMPHTFAGRSHRTPSAESPQRSDVASTTGVAICTPTQIQQLAASTASGPRHACQRAAALVQRTAPVSRIPTDQSQSAVDRSMSVEKSAGSIAMSAYGKVLLHCQLPPSQVQRTGYSHSQSEHEWMLSSHRPLGSPWSGNIPRQSTWLADGPGPSHSCGPLLHADHRTSTSSNERRMSSLRCNQRAHRRFESLRPGARRDRDTRVS